MKWAFFESSQVTKVHKSVGVGSDASFTANANVNDNDNVNADINFGNNIDVYPIMWFQR